MTWNESLTIGIPQIDQQHKELFGMLDDLYHASVQGKGSEEVVRLLEFLETYTNRHFEDEEKLQMEIGSPLFVWHKAQHDGMRQQVAEMKKELISCGATLSMVKTVNETITTWWFRHIMGFDMNIKKYIK